MQAIWERSKGNIETSLDPRRLPLIGPADVHDQGRIRRPELLSKVRGADSLALPRETGGAGGGRFQVPSHQVEADPAQPHGRVCLGPRFRDQHDRELRIEQGAHPRGEGPAQRYVEAARKVSLCKRRRVAHVQGVSPLLHQIQHLLIRDGPQAPFQHLGQRLPLLRVQDRVIGKVLRRLRLVL